MLDKDLLVSVGIVTILLILLLIKISYTTSRSETKHSCSHKSMDKSISGGDYDRMMHEVGSEVIESAPSLSLREIERDTQSRGFVATANQPDHTANFWKSDVSQSADVDKDDNNDSANLYLCAKISSVGSSTEQSSDTHLISRFGSERS